MGIFINMIISKSVTREEWEKVYEETLLLVKKFPFAEKRKIKIHDVDTICLVPTEERETTYRWNREKTQIGWNTVGDYTYMRTAENYYLPRNLVGDNKVEPEAGDAIFGALPAYLPYDWNDEKFNHVYQEWGAKTQGEPYHMYLLAIACLIEARLGTKAFTYGDITRGQCKKAVEIANEYLESPIEMPDRCDVKRSLKRVSQLPLSENEQLDVFEKFYLGTKDAAFGAYIRQSFSNEAIEAFWKQEFAGYKLGTIGFNDCFYNYMLWGFDLERLCGYVSFQDGEGNLKYDIFIKCVMDDKFHLVDKNCEDALKIDQEEEHPYGIWTLMAQFAFSGAKNKKVNRYIPIKEIRSALNAGIGDKCNVDEIIDAYLAKEAEQMKINIMDEDVSDEDFDMAIRQDPADAFHQVMEKTRENGLEKLEKYDINDYDDMIFYEKGDTMRPVLMKSLGGSRKFLDTALEEEEFSELMEEDSRRRCEWLIEQNRYFLMRDKDWEKIFADIEENKESFGRYYPLFRVRIESDGLMDMSIALLINDDLYAYSKELAEQEEE